jgi:glycosyltransferase involved in cell wall biosynthesis
MRVSLILHKFSRGGSDRVAAHLARGFADRGMDVELQVFCRGGEVEKVLTDVVGDDIPIRYLGRATGVRPLDLMFGLPKLVRVLRGRQPDVIISTANNTALITAIAVQLARLRHARLILKTTNPIATSRHTGLTRWIRLWSYRAIFGWTDAVWTLSADESAEMRTEFPEFAALFADVRNPYVTPAMLAGPNGAGSDGRKTVICVARLTAQKRLDRLIAAFARVQHPTARLLILGEGEQRETLTKMVAHLGLEDRVSMPGYSPDVAAELHAADLFVLTSDYEGLPAAVLEAMAANCPVLSTECFPAARSLLGQAEGCALIERTDPASLAALIDAHLARPRSTTLRALAERYSIANGVASHAQALLATD